MNKSKYSSSSISNNNNNNNNNNNKQCFPLLSGYIDTVPTLFADRLFCIPLIGEFFAIARFHTHNTKHTHTAFSMPDKVHIYLFLALNVRRLSAAAVA